MPLKEPHFDFFASQLRSRFCKHVQQTFLSFLEFNKAQKVNFIKCY